MGIDGFYTSIMGQDTGLMVAVNLGTGQLIALARIDEKYRPALFTWNWTIKFTAFIIYAGSTAC